MAMLHAKKSRCPPRKIHAGTLTHRDVYTSFIETARVINK